MQSWLRRIRGPVGMVLTWTAAGALVGALIELGNDAVPGGLPMGALVDVWPPVLALVGRDQQYPALLLGGVVYSSVLGLVRLPGAGAFDELSLSPIRRLGSVRKPGSRLRASCRRGLRHRR